jgi:hypothetical protein
MTYSEFSGDGVDHVDVESVQRLGSVECERAEIGICFSEHGRLNRAWKCESVLLAGCEEEGR